MKSSLRKCDWGFVRAADQHRLWNIANGANILTKYTYFLVMCQFTRTLDEGFRLSVPNIHSFIAKNIILILFIISIAFQHGPNLDAIGVWAQYVVPNSLSVSPDWFLSWPTPIHPSNKYGILFRADQSSGEQILVTIVSSFVRSTLWQTWQHTSARPTRRQITKA